MTKQINLRLDEDLIKVFEELAENENLDHSSFGCPNEDRKILVSHKVQDVNIESYVKMNYKQYIELYEKSYLIVS